MVTFHLVEIAPGISVCLVKSIENEIPPKELEERLPKLTEHISVSAFHSYTITLHYYSDCGVIREVRRVTVCIMKKGASRS